MAGFEQFAGLANILAGGMIAQSGAQAQASNIITAGEIQAQGSLMTAAGFRVSKQSVQDVANFNIQVQKINELRQLSSMSRQFQRTLGANMSAVSGSGISVSSKSALMVRNEVAGTFEKAMLNFKLDAENRRRATIFESNIRQTNLENQARASEYQAAASRVLAANRASETSAAGTASMFQSFTKAAGSLSSIF